MGWPVYSECCLIRSRGAKLAQRPPTPQNRCTEGYARFSRRVAFCSARLEHVAPAGAISGAAPPLELGCFVTAAGIPPLGLLPLRDGGFSPVVEGEFAPFVVEVEVALADVFGTFKAGAPGGALAGRVALEPSRRDEAPARLTTLPTAPPPARDFALPDGRAEARAAAATCDGASLISSNTAAATAVVDAATSDTPFPPDPPSGPLSDNRVPTNVPTATT